MQFAVIGMGRWGGGELGYASDLDLLYVYDVPEGEDPVEARDQALKLANLLGVALGGVRPEGIAYRVDAGLRPEGRAGPLARSLRVLRRLWERWAEPWELQALIKRAQWPETRSWPPASSPRPVPGSGSSSCRPTYSG